MYELITKENITFFLALVGSLGTVFFWFKSFIDNKAKINFIISAYLVPKENKLILYAMIENQSRLPVSINEISIIADDIRYRCTTIPLKVFESVIKQNNQIISSEEEYSLKMPIVLNPLCGTSGYLHFADTPNYDKTISNNLTFEFCTNRGKKLRKTLSLKVVPHLD